jgi:hypothetical protein
MRITLVLVLVVAIQFEEFGVKFFGIVVGQVGTNTSFLPAWDIMVWPMPIRAEPA